MANDDKYNALKEQVAEWWRREYGWRESFDSESLWTEASWDTELLDKAGVDLNRRPVNKKDEEPQ